MKGYDSREGGWWVQTSEGPGWEEGKTERQCREMELGDTQVLDRVARAMRSTVTFCFYCGGNRNQLRFIGAGGLK